MRSSRKRVWILRSPVLSPQTGMRMPWRSLMSRKRSGPWSATCLGATFISVVAMRAQLAARRSTSPGRERRHGRRRPRWSGVWSAKRSSVPSTRDQEPLKMRLR
ncbi:hypothetical protein VDGD_20801 [Verticillium dahliae]|nr:hypothetical protein VDGD_20801 [Verticillium dahliae]